MPHVLASEPSQRLAVAVRERMTELRLNQNDVAAAGGPSGVTLRKLLAAERGTVAEGVKPSTLVSLDTALRWEPGTAADILTGGDPRPMSAPLTTIRGHDPVLGEVVLAVPAESLAGLSPTVRAAADANAIAAFLKTVIESGVLGE